MGLENDFEEMKDVATGQGGNDGDNNSTQQGGGNDNTEDTMVDSAVDEFAQKEGMSAGFDPEVNNVVNDEVNKF